MLVQPETVSYLDFHLADADVRIYAPQNVLDVLDKMLAHIPHEWSGVLEPISVTVTAAFESDMWYIGGATAASRKALDRNSTLPQIAGAAVSSLLAELGDRRKISIWRAAVVSYEGDALVLVGDDWESAITVAAHLHARGWRMVSGDYAVVDLASMHALPFRKLLHVSSSSLSSFPVTYRGAIEASPWYSSTDAISFYAIDPTIVNGERAWGERSAIRAVVKLDGRIAQHPSLEACADFAISESLLCKDLGAGVETAMLVLGGFVESADFLERWARALPPPR